jgi:hypothetical protein
LRDLNQKNQLAGNRLIYSNKTSEDIIMKDELEQPLKGDLINLYTREKVMGFIGKRIDRKYLIEYITDFGQQFYICGSTEFVKNISAYLVDLGANIDAVVFEKS